MRAIIAFNHKGLMGYKLIISRKSNVMPRSLEVLGIMGEVLLPAFWGRFYDPVFIRMGV
jgi:hypothetical protein